jgi:cellulose synthase/poly-beta-1,6-N-acetylglucosamine synthase-like glycosyltransferase
MIAAEIVFGLCVVLLFYTYLGYPLHVLVLAKLFAKPVERAPFPGTVSVLISVHDEAARLPEKVRSLLAGGGSAEIREILIGSDGSSDDPAAALAPLDDARIRVRAFAARRGKPSVLNDLLREATGDVVVMTDARQPLAAGALDALLAPFADRSVGVVSGHLVFRMPEAAGGATHGVGTYWSYEKGIRHAESLTGSVPGATGALYAIRRSLLAPIPADTLLDDVAIPMHAIAQGGRCLFEPEAVCYDVPSVSSEREAIRKRRTIAGNIQLMLRHPGWLLPWRQPAWWRFLGHKVLRLFAPFWLAALLGACLVLRDRHPFFAAGALAQIACWLFAWVAFGLSRRGVRCGRLAGIAEVFLMLNVATVLAWWDALRGRYEPAWQRSAGGAR